MKEVYKNVNLVEIPLTGNPLKTMNIFVITTDEGNMIIDTGFNNEENRSTMDKLIEDLNLDLSKTSLFLTHLHSDHVGLAKYLEEKGIKEIFISAVDMELVREGTALEGKQWQDIIKNAKLQGLGEENLDIHNHPGFKNRPEEMFEHTELHPGDKISLGEFNFEVIDEAGHTPGMIGLYDKDKKILFCGDHILGKITPNITWWGDDYGDSLGIYLKNLEKIKDLDVKYLFSSHRFLVDDTNERIETLKKHHDARLEDTLSILKKLGRANTTEITRHMQWDIRAKDWNDFPESQKWFAVGEASAHLKYLLGKGIVTEELSDDGVYYYSLA